MRKRSCRLSCLCASEKSLVLKPFTKAWISVTPKPAIVQHFDFATRFRLRCIVARSPPTHKQPILLRRRLKLAPDSCTTRAFGFRVYKEVSDLCRNLCLAGETPKRYRSAKGGITKKTSAILFPIKRYLVSQTASLLRWSVIPATRLQEFPPQSTICESAATQTVNPIKFRTDRQRRVRKRTSPEDQVSEVVGR